jgi:hypothetical protein
MPFHRGIDPAHNLAIDNSGEGDPVGSARQLINALAKILRRAGIAELAAQFGGPFRIVCRKPPNQQTCNVPFLGFHTTIIARRGSIAGSK